MYYIFNAEEEFPIVLAPKSMLYLVRTIGKMQILGKEIEKRLKREKDMTGPCEDEIDGLPPMKHQYSVTIALQKNSIVRLLIVSFDTYVVLNVVEYYISHKTPTILTPVHGRLKMDLNESYTDLLLFAL